MEPPEYVYHTTFLQNLGGIASEGLQPSTRAQFGGYARHSLGRVFVSDFDGVSLWASRMESVGMGESDLRTDADVADWMPIVLRIGDSVAFEFDPLGHCDSGWCGPWYVENRIGPEHIEVWDGREWVMVEDADISAMRQRALDSASFESEETDEYGEDGWWEADFDALLPPGP